MIGLFPVSGSATEQGGVHTSGTELPRPVRTGNYLVQSILAKSARPQAAACAKASFLVSVANKLEADSAVQFHCKSGRQALAGLEPFSA